MFGISSILSKRSGCSAKVKAGVANFQEQHTLELEQFKKVLESVDSSKVEERLLVLEAFLSAEKHFTVSDLEYLLQKEKNITFDRSFIQKSMEMFCLFGFATEVAFENQETRFEHHHLGTHHDHFICTRCGQIHEFTNHKLERLQIDIARAFQFHPLQHKMEIYGLCAKCMEQRDSTLSLVMASNGERVRIIKIDGGRDIHARLGSMGIAVDTCIEVINNNAVGQVLVAVEGTRLALNRGIAQKILVKHSCHPR